MTPRPPAPPTQSERPHPLSPLVDMAVWIAAFLFFAFQNIAQELPKEDLGGLLREPKLIVGIVVALIIMGLVAYLSWRTTQFVIDDDEVRVEHNFIQHESQRISFSKIQSIDIRQPLIARILGLAMLQIDVGADGAKKIKYLSLPRANRMRDELLARAAAHRTPTHQPQFDGTTPAGPDPLGAIPGQQPGVPIIAVKLWRSVVATLTGSMMMGILIFLLLMGLALAGVAWALELVAGDTEAISTWTFILPIIVGMVIPFFSKFTQEANFSLVATPDGLRVSQGLLSLSTRALPVHRIQAVQINQPLLWRLFGWYSVEMDVLGFTAGDSAPTSTLLPVGTRSEVDAVLRAIWPGFDLQSVQMHPIPKRARWLRPIDAHKFTWGLSDDAIVATGFWFTHIIAIVPHARVQSVRLQQGPLQRWLGLASVQAHTPPGPVHFACRHLDAAVARELALDETDRMRAARAALPDTLRARPRRAL